MDLVANLEHRKLFILIRTLVPSTPNFPSMHVTCSDWMPQTSLRCSFSSSLTLAGAKGVGYTQLGGLTGVRSSGSERLKSRWMFTSQSSCSSAGSDATVRIVWIVCLKRFLFSIKSLLLTNEFEKKNEEKCCGVHDVLRKQPQSLHL